MDYQIKEALLKLLRSVTELVEELTVYVRNRK